MVILEIMTKRQRITLGGYVYHILNRANGRLRIVRQDGDCVAFEDHRDAVCQNSN